MVRALWRWFRSGVTKRDLVIAAGVLTFVAGSVLVKALTGWPHVNVIVVLNVLFVVLVLFGEILLGILSNALGVYWMNPDKVLTNAIFDRDDEAGPSEPKGLFDSRAWRSW